MLNENKTNGIWVAAECRDGDIAQCSLELLAKAEMLAKAAEDQVTAVLLGYETGALAQKLIAHGADRVIRVDHPALAAYKPRVYEKALTEVVRKYQPSVLLLSATAQGRDLAPRVMCSLKTGLTADCLDLDMEDGLLIQHKPSYGGNIMCDIVIKDRRPQMATVRPGVFTPLEEDEARTGEVVDEAITLEDDPDYEIISHDKKAETTEPIDKAEVIVSCGRGVKEKEDLAMFEELAGLIGGRVGCSRPLVDEGWMPHELQIGQSGTTVKPKLIFNVGISGAVQYVVGMQNSKCIISVNRNDQAEILNASHYAAVADYKELIPAVIEEIKKRKAM